MALAAAVALCASSCARASGNEATSQVEESAVRDTLLRGLNARLERLGQTEKVGRDRVTFTAEASTAVSGLHYHWVTFRDANVSHGFWFVVAASRGPRISLIETAADWSAVVGGWDIASDQEAITACFELIRFTDHAYGPTFPFRVYDDPGALSEPMLVGVSDLTPGRLTTPQVEQSERGGWTTTLWVLQVRQTKEYVCRLPGRSDPQASAAFTVVDSVPGVGFISPIR